MHQTHPQEKRLHDFCPRIAAAEIPPGSPMYRHEAGWPVAGGLTLSKNLFETLAGNLPDFGRR
jgi:cytosine/uracil/thiamine/allantoin permease